MNLRNIIEKHGVYILIILSLAMFLLRGTGLMGLILSKDIGAFPFYPYEELKIHLFTWNELELGQTKLNFLTIPIFYFYLFLFEYLGLPIEIIQRILYISIFSFMGLSMYYLVNVLLGERRRQIGLVSSIFFMFNPFTMSFLYANQLLLFISLPFMPLILAFYIRGIKEKNNLILNSLIVSILSVLLQSSAYPPAIVLAALPTILYFFFAIIVEENKAHLIKFSALVLMLSILLNAWWLIPYFYIFTSTNYMQYITELKYTTEAVLSSKGVLNPSFIFRLWDHRSPLFANFINFRDSTFNKTTGFILLAAIYIPLSLAIKNKIQKTKPNFEDANFIIFFSFIGLTGTLLALGPNGPTGPLFMFIWENFKPFQIFRATTKFLTISTLAYAMLLGIFLKIIFTKVEGLNFSPAGKSKIKFYLTGFTIFIVIANVLPMLTGNYSPHIQEIDSKAVEDIRYDIVLEPVEVPIDYFVYRQSVLSNQDRRFRAFVLPQRNVVQYTWAPYESLDIIRHISPVPIVYGGINYEFPTPTSSDFILTSYSKIRENDPGLFSLIDLMGVKYIILHKDIELPGYNPSTFEKTFDDKFKKESKISGKNLTIYQNNNYFPDIYATKNLRYFDNLFQSLSASPLNSSDLEVLVTNEVDSLNSGTVDIKTTKINPTKYEISASNEGDPYILVLSQSFHPSWKAYVINDNEGAQWYNLLFKKPIKDENHILVNGYANGWIVNNRGNHLIILSFYPQNLYYLGWTISIMSFISICILVFIEKSKEGRRHER